MVEQDAMRKENEACVMKIRGILHGRGDSITKMEAALGFGNGTIGKWAKGSRRPPYDKLLAIGEYLGVSVREIYPEMVKTENPATGEGDGGKADTDMIKDEINELFDSLDSSDRALLLAFAQRLKASQGNRGEGNQ